MQIVEEVVEVPKVQIAEKFLLEQTIAAESEKALHEKIASLERDIVSWQAKYDEKCAEKKQALREQDASWQSEFDKRCAESERTLREQNSNL